MSVAPDRSSPQVIYASKAGVVADDSTDNTATIQAALDRFGGTTPLQLIFDQPGIAIVAGTLYLWSNQTLSGVSGATLKKGGFPASNAWALISNKNPTVTGSSQTDAYITIRDLYIDGNKRGGANGVSGGGSNPWPNPSGWVVPTLGLYGVAHFRLDNVRIYDSPAYKYPLRQFHRWDGGRLLGARRRGRGRRR